MAMGKDERCEVTIPEARAGERRRLGTATGDFVVPDDFDAPLPESVLAEFEK